MRAVWRNLPDDTICTLADDILNVILLAHVEGYLPRTLRVRRSGGGARHGGVWRMVEARKRGGGGAAVVEGGVGVIDIGSATQSPGELAGLGEAGT